MIIGIWNYGPGPDPYIQILTITTLRPSVRDNSKELSYGWGYVKLSQTSNVGYKFANTALRSVAQLGLKETCDDVEIWHKGFVINWDSKLRIWQALYEDLGNKLDISEARCRRKRNTGAPHHVWPTLKGDILKGKILYEAEWVGYRVMIDRVVLTLWRRNSIRIYYLERCLEKTIPIIIRKLPDCHNFADDIFKCIFSNEND